MWMLAAFVALFSVFFYQYTIPLTIAAKNKEKAPERNIIVVGGGLAGMSAAIEAELHGAKVTIIDKEPNFGGNSAKASSGINGVLTKAQRLASIDDNVEEFVKDTLKSGQGLSDVKLVEVLAQDSTTAIDWVTLFGVDLDVLSKCGGHSFPRTHRSSVDERGRPRNIGWEIVSKLIDYINSLPDDRIKTIYGAKMTKLITNANGDVIGVKYLDFLSKNEISVYADAVILATGGYSRDSELLNKYAPSIAKLPSTNGNFATGDGVKVAQEIGAELSLMDKVQVHPTGFVDPKDPNNPTKWLGPEALRASGGILLNAKGERFVNELGLRDHVTHEIFKNCKPMKLADGADGPVTSYIVLNDEAVNLFQAPVLEFYRSKGFVQDFPNAQAMATALNFDYEVVKSTIENYHKSKEAKKDPFGKDTFPVIFSLDEPLHVAMITPSIHYTMGGLTIDAQGQVLKKSTKEGEHTPIKGLFAAGEVTGGLHGENRLAGNSLLECVVFGRRAAKSAVGPYEHPYHEQYIPAFKKIRAIVGESRFSEKPSIRVIHGRDASYHQSKMPDAVVFPNTTEEVSEIVKVCFEYGIPIVPYGVGSALEGHVHAIKGGLTIDMSTMNQVVKFHSGDMAVTVQAGIRRKALNTWLEDKKVFFPIDPGADASIGGMTATGASGTLAVGYGTMRENVIRLKVVLPDGRIMHTASRARKSSAGYDLTHLFIGSEGTLGVVTEITLKVYRIPPGIAAAVCSFEHVGDAANTVIQASQEGIKAHRIELLNSEAIRAVNMKFNLTYSVGPKLFLEFHGSDDAVVADISQKFIKIATDNHASTCEMTVDSKERDTLWQARHGAYWASASLCRGCKLYVTDVCVPISRLSECVVETDDDFKSSHLKGPLLGHVGDGNFHLMIPIDPKNPKDLPEAQRLNERLVKRDRKSVV